MKTAAAVAVVAAVFAAVLSAAGCTTAPAVTASAAAAATASAVTASSPPMLSPENAALVAAVTAAERAFAKTMADRDHAAFLGFIADDAVFLNGGKPLHGAVAIGDFWKRFYAAGPAPFSWQPDLVAVAASGRLAHSAGPVATPDGKVFARFYSTWRLEPDGRWRVVFDDGYNVCACDAPGSTPAGYSATPLARKLGIAAGCRVLLLNPPAPYAELLAPLPPDVTFGSVADTATDIVHLFTDRRQVLAEALAALRGSLRGNAAVWVSWPKKAARVPTDITEDTVREVALPLGFVDVKVCAVDAVWSGLKLVLRRELRRPAA